MGPVDKTLADVRRRAGRVRGRLTRARARGSSAEDAQPPVAEQLRRARARARRQAAGAAELREELSRTRASVRDPFPWIPLDERVHATIEAVRSENLTYLSAENLTTLARVAAECEQAGREGLFIEAGTARGGSAIVLAAAKAAGRPLKVYDVFGMIPTPGERDGADVHRRYQKIVEGKSRGVGGETYYGYRTELYEEVAESFGRHGLPTEENRVDLVQGLFQDTIELDEPVALAHIDGDWYESTMTCLERIAPLLVPGGRLVIDDYWAWSGCRTAVDEYFADRPGYQVERRAKVHIVRL